MNAQHGIFDDALFVLLLAIPWIEWKWTWPRYLKRLATGAPGVRAAFYSSLMIGEWVPALCLLAWWAAKTRPWSGLLLKGTATRFATGIPPQMRLWAGLTFVALLVGIVVAQRMAVLARPEAMEQVRPKLKFAEPLLPHTAVERRLFWMVSLTAGVCEELFFRGFLIWYLMAWMGPLWAVLLSSMIFGAGHIYMGWMQAPKTAIVGLVLACIALGSASLFPAMLLHAAMDWNSGELAYRVIQGSGVREAGTKGTSDPCGQESPAGDPGSEQGS